MKKKVSLEEVEEVAVKNLPNNGKEVGEIMKGLQALLEDGDEEPKSNTKYEYVIVSVKNNDDNPDDLEDEYVRYIVKVEEGSDHSRIVESMKATIIDNNISAKTEKKKASSFMHGIEKGSKKSFKESNVMEVNIISKIPSITVTASNTI